MTDLPWLDGPESESPLRTPFALILAPSRHFCSASGSPESTAGASDSGEPPSALRAGLRSGKGRSAFAPAIARCGLCSRGPTRQKRIIFRLLPHPAAEASGRDSPRSAHTRLTVANSLPHGAPASLVLAPAGARAGLASSEALSVPSVRRIYALGPRCPFHSCASCRARPGPAHFGGSAFRNLDCRSCVTAASALSRLTSPPTRLPPPAVSSVRPPGLSAIARPSPRLRAHSLAQTRTSATLSACGQRAPCAALGWRSVRP